MAETPPPALREQVARTLRPVRPVPSPMHRLAALIPVGALVLAAVPIVWGIRDDAADLGPLRLWGGSALQMGIGLLLLAGALAETVPGRLGPLQHFAGRIVLGIACVFALTVATFLASPTQVPPFLASRYARVCFTGSFGLGLLPLSMAGLLMLGGLVVRPLVGGALAGLGAGLLADAGWRLYCRASDPAHVLTVHLGAVASVTLVGLLAGVLVSRRRRPSDVAAR